ncbi:MAG: hypothetical protein IKI21_04620 [Oscillospiraceae bacterium]|nr:hypothetical protein [Oscillospiraceae bacterium]
MKPREYGGFLPLERGDGEWYQSAPGRSVRRYNAARYAIVTAVQDSGCRRVYVPHYLCASVYQALDRYAIDYEKYHLADDLSPALSTIEEDAVIVITNYFGVLPHSFFREQAARFPHVIFDHTQGFFTAPTLQDGVYDVYSPRKFVGVCDGAYLVTRGPIRQPPLPKDCSAARAAYLLHTLEDGTNANYAASLASEDALTQAGMKEMSDVTQSLLSIAPYDRIRQRRKANFAAAHAQLASHNALRCLCDAALTDDDVTPMVYPLLLPVDGGAMRRRLVSQRIYVPQWWRAVLEEGQANAWEAHLSEDLIPLPIDQRYDEEDIRTICAVVLSA